jgi:LEA14-like dessication related protein
MPYWEWFLKKMMKRIGIILFAAFVALSSCKQPKELVYEGMGNFSIKQAGAKQTTLSMNISLYNPNKYKLKLKSADVDAFLNGNHIGKMNVTDAYELAASDTTSLPVMLNVDLQNILPNALQILLNREVTIKLTGKIIAGRHGVYISLPVNYETRQDILSGTNW